MIAKPQHSTHKVLVTGASGFVGQVLVPELVERGYSVRAVVRRSAGIIGEFNVGHIGPRTRWHEALADIDVVIHLAGRAHVLKEAVDDPLPLYREINTEGTRHLAECAAAAGVRRMVFISSIKVNGETTTTAPFTAADVPAPQDAYGISKWEAEQALQDVAGRTGIEFCIIRPPLVYGPGVAANFLRLIQLVRSGIPIPLGAVTNRRSLVSVYNLCDLIIRCIDHAAANGQTFLVSDNDDLSIVDLLRKLSDALDIPLRLFSVPPAVLMVLLSLVGRRRDFDRLCGSLQADISATMTTLSWQPPITAQEGICRVVAPPEPK
jgi:nucleoside-diphosphate-sugar epimerase